jgi:hypothetical protein
MKNEPKKPDLRDNSGPPTTISRNDRKFVEEPDADTDINTLHTVKPGPSVQAPGQTSKQ